MGNDHNVYILGAGFSSDAGLPLVSQFLNRLRDSAMWLESNARNEEFNAVKEVLEFRLKAAAAAYRVRLDVENIEELFSLAAASEGDTLTDHVIWAIAATLDYCEKIAPEPKAVTMIVEDSHYKPLPHWSQTTAIQDGRQVPKYEFYMGMLSGKFCERLEVRKNTIIPFNYDLIVERSLQRTGVPYTYKLPSEVMIDDSTRSGDLGQEEGSIPVLKLHGSVNWGYPEERGKHLTIYGDYEAARGRAKHLELAPPTWKKSPGAELVTVWEWAVRALEEATRVVIIGFSIPPTDIHFKYLVAAGLRGNISMRQLVLVNPAEVEVRKRLLCILRDELERRGVIDVKKQTLFNFFSGRRLPEVD